MDISKRLLQVVDYANITANAFAVKIGVSQPRFRNYLNGRAPDYETLSQICKTFVVISERWLLTGEGEMLKTDIQPNNPSSDLNTSNMISMPIEVWEVIKNQSDSLRLKDEQTQKLIDLLRLQLDKMSTQKSNE